jgi:hypothetical protein
MKGRRTATYTGAAMLQKVELLKQESAFGAVVLKDCQPQSLRVDVYKSGRTRLTLKVIAYDGQPLTYKLVEG